ncbi:hypothetical protein [Arachidicoccus terrestris]|uniref:hypothetical protein n=1 Tax=Arachidicoccus terrestris TaxID=2875539 RepID=UPI001CC4DE11|nr:hypothetical protein [Arachidicoccus terrestris]UAY55152.1 hypothetical protein K9M52_17290 [Arachidicoccus terrestris]
MDNEEKDIIRQLADKLRDSELPYKEGAWERFAAMEAKANTVTGISESGDHAGTRIRSLLRPWIGIAAALVLAAGAGWLYLANHRNAQPANSRPAGQITSTTSEQLETPQSQNRDNNNNGRSLPTNDQISSDIGKTGHERALASLQNSVGLGSTPIGQPDVHMPSGRLFNFPYLIEQTGIIPLGNPFGQNDRTAAAHIYEDGLVSINTNRQRNIPGLRIPPVGPVYTYIETPAAQADEQRVATVVSHSNEADKSAAVMNKDAYFDDKGYFNLDDNQSARKWNMGVVVIPAVSNAAKLNMGYGVSVGYRLSNRLSINSGLAYTELSGSKDADQQATIVSSGRTLSSIDATATGLNVPLELRYHISQKIYIGTGVSALAVLSDKVERKYAIAEMQTSAFEAKNGQPLKPDAMQSIASDIRTKEVLPEDQVGSKDFAGFINFSFGFKQPLNKSKSLSIEPFISIPMSNHLFNQNIRMTDGGLRIKLGL